MSVEHQKISGLPALATLTAATLFEVALAGATYSVTPDVISSYITDNKGADIKTAYEAQADTNAFTDALLAKLNGIETNATADQTGAEIKALYEAEADTNAFTDALLSKLNNIEASADVTDAANVGAAIAGAASKTTPVGADTFGLIDSADSSALKQVSFTNLLAAIGSGTSLGGLSDVTITSIGVDEVLKWNGSAWINNTLAEAGISAVGHTHATTDITSGTFADALIAASNVTQHQGSIDHGSIAGLGDDDHTIYLLINGSRAMTGDLDMGANNIENVATLVVGANTTADGTLHVHTASAGSVNAGSWADDLVVENSGDGGVTVLVPDTANGHYAFGSPADPFVGGLKYIFNATVADGYMELWAANAAQVTINTTGAGFGSETDPQAAIHVLGPDGAGTVPTLAADHAAIFQNNAAAGDSCRVTIIAGASGASFLQFGDANNDNPGMVKYDHSNDTAQCWAGGAEVMRFASSEIKLLKDTTIGANKSPSTALNVVGPDGAGTTPTLNADTVAIFENSSANGVPCRVSIISGNNTSATLYFGDTDAEARGWINYPHNLEQLQLGANNGTRVAIASAGMAVGTTTIPTGLTNGVIMTTGTAPTSNANGSIALYSVDPGTSELWFEDDAGTATQVTSHGMSRYDPLPQDPLPFSHTSLNHYVGRKVNFDQSGMAIVFEELLAHPNMLAIAADLSRTKFLHYEEYTPRDWDQNQQWAVNEKREGEIQKKLEHEKVEVTKAEATELVPVMVEEIEEEIPGTDAFEDVPEKVVVEDPDNKETIVVPDPENNSFKEVERQRRVEVETGKINRKLKPDVRFDEASRKFLRLRRNEFEDGPVRKVLDKATNKIVTEIVQVPKKFDSGEKEWRVKAGYEFRDGKFYRRMTRQEAEAEVDPAIPKPKPKLLAHAEGVTIPRNRLN